MGGSGSVMRGLVILCCGQKCDRVLGDSESVTWGLVIFRVGHNRIYTPYMTVYLVISCQKNRIHTVYIWFWPTLVLLCCGQKCERV